MCDKAVEKDSKMLKMVLDYFKTQDKKLLLEIIYVSDQHKAQ